MKLRQLNNRAELNVRTGINKGGLDMAGLKLK